MIKMDVIQKIVSACEDTLAAIDDEKWEGLWWGIVARELVFQSRRLDPAKSKVEEERRYLAKLKAGYLSAADTIDRRHSASSVELAGVVKYVTLLRNYQAGRIARDQPKMEATFDV